MLLQLMPIISFIIVNCSKDSAIAQESSSSSSHHSSPHYVGSDSELTTSGIVSSFNADSFLFGMYSYVCSILGIGVLSIHENAVSKYNGGKERINASIVAFFAIYYVIQLSYTHNYSCKLQMVI